MEGRGGTVGDDSKNLFRVGKATKSSQKGPIPRHKAKEASS